MNDNVLNDMTEIANYYNFEFSNKEEFLKEMSIQRWNSFMYMYDTLKNSNFGKVPSDDFIREFVEHIGWTNYCGKIVPSEDIICEFPEKIHWHNLIITHFYKNKFNLDKKFVELFPEKIQSTVISTEDGLSFEEIIEKNSIHNPIVLGKVYFAYSQTHHQYRILEFSMDKSMIFVEKTLSYQ